MIQAEHDNVKMQVFLVLLAFSVPVQFCLRCVMVYWAELEILMVLEVAFCVTGLIKRTVGIHAVLLPYLVDGSEEELTCVICWVVGVIYSVYSTNLCGVLCTSFVFVAWRIYCESEFCRKLWSFCRKLSIVLDSF